MSLKGAKIRRRITGLRSKTSKARTHVDRLHAANADLKKKLAEALEQQAATSEVLGVISRSPGELERVFQAMLSRISDLTRMGARSARLDPHSGAAAQGVRGRLSWNPPAKDAVADHRAKPGPNQRGASRRAGAGGLAARAAAGYISAGLSPAVDYPGCYPCGGRDALLAPSA